MNAIVFSAEADLDLEDIADYIARENPRRAVTFVSVLRAASRRIAFTPFFGSPLVPKLEMRELRRRPYGNYLIYYKVDKDAVKIARILHQARDQAAALGY